MADYPHLEITPEIRSMLDASPRIRVYEITDDNGESVWAVVDSEEKARQAYRDYLDEDGDSHDLEIRALPDEEPLELGDEDTGESTTKTAAEWADSYGDGTGFLASTVW